MGEESCGRENKQSLRRDVGLALHDKMTAFVGGAALFV